MAGKIQIGADLKIQDILGNLEDIVAGLDASQIDLTLLQGQDDDTQTNQQLIDQLLADKETEKRLSMARAKSARSEFKVNPKATLPRRSQLHLRR